MKYQHLDAIILFTKAMFEKDKWVEVFTLEHGKLRLLAKNALGKRSKYHYSWETLTHVDLTLYPGKSFLLGKECDIRNSFLNIRSSFNRISMAQYFVNLVRKTTQFEQSNPALFKLLLKALSELDKAEIELSDLQRDFQNHLLIAEGLLAQNKQPLSNTQFKQILETYTGFVVQDPLLV